LQVHALFARIGHFLWGFSLKNAINDCSNAF